MHSVPGPDNGFGTEALRSSVLQAWRASPTRFTEDTNTERDLRVGGYHDRLFVELAQNAADAAAQAGVPGHIRVSLVEGELRVANTGAPLDAGGVAALAALRASTKPEDNVGRFGVGFAAVLTVTSEPRIVSRTGGVAFSQARTRAAAGVDGAVPILRLPWPLPDEEPGVPDGFDTEVRLPLRVDPAEVLDRIRAEVADVLLALPWLVGIEVEGERWTRSVSDGIVELTAPGGHRTRWLTQVGEHSVWAVPVNDRGVPQPLDDDVLYAPTPTDEGLGMPARLFASVPVEPSRRRVLSGAPVRRVLQDAAHVYPDLVCNVPPAHRLTLVPQADFPRSDLDAALRELVLDALAERPWLPSAVNGELPGQQARVLGPDSTELAELLAEVVPGLVAAPFTGPHTARVLTRIGATTLTMPELVEAVTGIEREPSWWHTLYDVLLAGVEQHEIETDELGALPVPLCDGRTVPGPRGALLLDEVSLVAELDVAGLHVVHPGAAHPLLERLGAVRAGAGELLRAPALEEAIERSAEDALAGVDVRPLVTTVLRLVAATGAGRLEALALPTRSGDWRRAGELVLPGSALLDVLDPGALGEDAPLDVLDPEFVAQWHPEVLTAIGVLDGFPVAEDDLAGDLDEGLDEDEPPVPDLDLVADNAWPAAVRLLAARPETGRALAAPEGRLRRWLSDNALLAGHPPNHWRLPTADGLAGLLDPVPDVGLSDDLLIAIGVRADLAVSGPADAELLCARLADRDRVVAPGLVLRAHTALADVVPEEVAPPDAVRTLDGSVVDAADAVVLDAPWLIAVWPPAHMVAGSDYAVAPALADVLDLPLATEETTVEVTSAGEFVLWADLPAIREVAELLGTEVPDGGVQVHEQLTAGAQPVPWWYDGTLHAADTSEGLARAFAWAVDRWPDRLLAVALLDDPDPRTLL